MPKQESSMNDKPAAPKPESKLMDLGRAPTKPTQYSFDLSRVCYPEKGRADGRIQR